MIERKQYLDKLIRKKGNGLIKVITGIRRCGKSYLLFNIYYHYLLSIGVKEDHIICLALDETKNAKFRNPLFLDEYLQNQIVDNGKYYFFLDEIQKVKDIQNPYLDDKEEKITFVDVLLGLMKKENADIYVTGSNSKMLSSDILTEFRGRSDEIRVAPLSYSEFYNAYAGDKHNAWNEYVTYGGMPYALTLQTHEDKRDYLQGLFEKVYIADVLERRKLINETDILEDVLDIISSSVGSLTNPTKISNTFKTVKHISITPKTIGRYLDHFIDAFIINKVQRYDIKGKNYIESPLKYYFVDVGLRNARLNFRQQEENHIMENVIYNELCLRGFSVDVGIVESSVKTAEGKQQRVQLEVDFVANKGSQRYYIQSAFAIPDEAKKQQETKVFSRIADSFKKVVIVRESILPWHDEQGILYIGVEQFLLDDKAIDF
jgi:hypothetical protein